MEYKIEEKSAPGRGKVAVLGATFDEGRPEGEEMGQWRQKLSSREDKLKYLCLNPNIKENCPSKVDGEEVNAKY